MYVYEMMTVLYTYLWSSFRDVHVSWFIILYTLYSAVGQLNLKLEGKKTRSWLWRCQLQTWFVETTFFCVPFPPNWLLSVPPTVQGVIQALPLQAPSLSSHPLN